MSIISTISRLIKFIIVNIYSFYIIIKNMLKNLKHSNILIDSFGRKIDYLRISVTDRCNLRCTYCMPEKMKFLPKKDILSFEEMEILCEKFIHRGIRKIRITGGEPLVRKGIIEFISSLNNYKDNNLIDEITMTTNGTLLEKYAEDLFNSGVRRLNISLDTLSENKFNKITLRNDLTKVLKGIEKAKRIGFKIKINTVVLKNTNVDEIPNIISWAHSNDFNISLIETMPLGDVENNRFDEYFPINKMIEIIERNFTLEKSNYKTSGPSNYFKVKETNKELGLITPLSNNFCSNCNRIRITCTGLLYMCLGQDNKIDFKEILRSGDNYLLNNAIDLAMKKKPEKHEFKINNRNESAKIKRHMSVTGG